MTELNRYDDVFCEIFNVNLNALQNDFSKDSVENWDSIQQLSLVTRIEDIFDIMLEPDEIINFTSYLKGKEILNKYGIAL